MAWTLLRFVNQCMGHLGLVGGEQANVVSFSDTARGRQISVLIQMTNETVHELYTTSTSPLPVEARERTITLRENDRNYELPSGCQQVRWPLVNEADSMTIYEYEGGYVAMRRFQLQPSQFKGTPYYACIHPETGDLYMDRFPLAGDAGRQYKIFYDRQLTLEHEGDLFPFLDGASRALVAAVVERYKMDQRGSGDEGIYYMSIARAMEMAGLKQLASKW